MNTKVLIIAALILLFAKNLATNFASGATSISKSSAVIMKQIPPFRKLIAANRKLKKNEYLTAFSMYQELYKKNPESAKLNYKIGACYLRMHDSKKAFEFFNKSLTLNPEFHDEELHLKLGEAFQRNGLFDKAQYEYNIFKQTLSQSKREVHPVNTYIEQCDYAKKMVAKPIDVKIENAGTRINTAAAEYSPAVVANGTGLMFSRQNNVLTEKKDASTRLYEEDTYWTSWDNATHSWSPLQNIRSYKNQENRTDTVGTKVFISLEGDICETIQYTDGSWGIATPLSFSVNSAYLENSPSVTADEKTLYFVSNRKGGEGKSDVYRSVKQASGSWGPAENLGDSINTEEDEVSVFVMPDGNTIYFSSKGHQSMGGYDIFKSSLVNGKWTTPENLGYPLNSTEDDVDFFIAPDGKHAYYSTVREDSKGNQDIYVADISSLHIAAYGNTATAAATMPSEDLTKAANKEQSTSKYSPITVLKGQVKDNAGKEISAEIELADVATQEVFSHFVSDKKGEFSITLATNRNYSLTAKKAGYDSYKGVIEIPVDTASLPVVAKSFILNKQAGAKEAAEETINNTESKTILFAHSDAVLKLENGKYAMLDELAEQMKKDAKMKVEVTGYTDEKGEPRYNKQLSWRRAEAVAKYLLGKNISHKRIKIKGQGANNPVASNDTEEGRTANRRVEVKVK